MNQVKYLHLKALITSPHLSGHFEAVQHAKLMPYRDMIDLRGPTHA
jgi:hypothetical protein